MATTKKPTFVVIPGSFHVTAHLDPLMTDLVARGYAGIVLQSPEIGVIGATEMLPQPEKPIRDELDRLILKEGEEVVLVCCSAGASRGSMAVKGFEKSKRASQGQAGGIICVVFVAGILVPEGGTIISAIGGGLPNWLSIDKERSMQLPSDVCGKVFYNDMSKEAQDHWASKLEPMSIRNHPLPVANACWDVDVPKMYVRTIKDQANLLQDQDRMLENVRKIRSQDWTVLTMDCGHSPFLSQVKEMGDVLEQAAQVSG